MEKLELLDINLKHQKESDSEQLLNIHQGFEVLYFFIFIALNRIQWINQETIQILCLDVQGFSCKNKEGANLFLIGSCKSLSQLKQREERGHKNQRGGSNKRLRFTEEDAPPPRRASPRLSFMKQNIHACTHTHTNTPNLCPPPRVTAKSETLYLTSSSRHGRSCYTCKHDFNLISAPEQKFACRRLEGVNKMDG